MCDEGYEESGCCTVGGLTDVILTLTGCKHIWGEVELPDCMRVEMESESEN